MVEDRVYYFQKEGLGKFSIPQYKIKYLIPLEGKKSTASEDWTMEGKDLPIQVKLSTLGGSDVICNLISIKNDIYYFEKDAIGEFAVAENQISFLEEFFGEEISRETEYFVKNNELPVQVAIQTIDGSELICMLYLVREEVYFFDKKEIGIFSLHRNDIIAIEYFNKTTKTRRITKNLDRLDPTRLTITDNGYTLAKGEILYHNAYLFGNSFQFGISNIFSMGLAFETASLFYGNNNSFLNGIIITPKFQIPVQSESINWAIGIYHAIEFESNDFTDVTAFYTSLTTASENNSFTIGLGIWKDYDIYSPVFQFAGNFGGNNSWKLVSENFIVPSNGDIYGVFSSSLRYQGIKVSLDLGVALVYESGYGTQPGPVGAFTLKF
jgi:hypothetical protein